MARPPSLYRKIGRPVQRAVRPLVKSQIENHIVGPDSHQSRRDRKKHHVNDVVGDDAEAGGPPHTQVDRKQQAGDDDDAVPVNRPVNDGDGKGHPVQGKLSPRPGNVTT